MRDLNIRLEDILFAISEIDRYAIKGREVFERDELVQTWIVRHLQIIGEASRALPDSLRSAIPGVPWKEIIGMRNILVHDYFGVDKDIVWGAVERDLPMLKAAIADYLSRKS